MEPTMQIPTPSLETIEAFLAQKRIAMIGISRNPKDFSASLFSELERRGYDVPPVNPKASEVMGRPCFARVRDIQPAVDGALLMTTPEVTPAVIADCAAAGIRRVWMYRAGAKGAVSEKAITFSQEHGIQVVPGQCPFMFLPGSGGVHSLHGFLRKIFGKYPKHQQAG
jgi:predicted CoA-binding protein